MPRFTHSHVVAYSLFSHRQIRGGTTRLYYQEPPPVFSPMHNQLFPVHHPFGAEFPVHHPFGAEFPVHHPFGAEFPVHHPFGAEFPVHHPFGAEFPVHHPFGAEFPVHHPFGAEFEEIMAQARALATFENQTAALRGPQRQQVIDPIQEINAPQSTHTESVHKTITKSIQKLNTRYQSVRVEDNIAAIKTFAKDITAKNFPEIRENVREAAKRFINRMDRLYSERERGSGISIKHILALLWAGIKDNTTGARLAEEHTALEKFIKHLYEIQRGYNINASGHDDGDAEDRSICVRGAINKLVDTLNGGLHKDVFILYVTKETAGEKLKILIKEGAVAFVKNAANKAELLEEINKLPVGSGSDLGWDIPEAILEKIKDTVEKKFHREFKNAITPAVLKEIFEGVYGYVLLDQNDLNKIASSSPTTTDEDAPEPELDEIEASPRPSILDEDSPVIERLFLAIDRLERYGIARWSSDRGKHDAAIDLAGELRGMLRSFICTNNAPNTLPMNFHEFKQGFSETLHRHDELFSEHRGYSRVILANIFIALTGIGALILGGKMAYSYFTTATVEGFFSKTKGQNMVDKITEDINNVELQMP